MEFLLDSLKMLYFVLQSTLHGLKLRKIQDNTQTIRKKDILLFSVLRNEAVRIPFFLEYYRTLGVGHFFFVDNASTDGFLDLVEDEPDVSVWYTDMSYKEANFGLHWSNHLMRQFGDGHWTIVADPDEFLVFPFMDKRPLQELTWHLEAENRRSFFCILLDMYSNKDISDTLYMQGSDPLETCSYFDAQGYTQKHNVSLLNSWVQGGVRSRIFFSDRPQDAPALNKTPLVKWKRTFSYVSSTHAALPKYINLPHANAHVSPTGVLLHFKFISQFRVKAEEEAHRGQHFGDSIEYRSYLERIDNDTTSMIYSGSVSYAGWEQLERLGLLNRGQWF